MPIKLIILDLDGTTLNSKQQITPRTKQIVRQAARNHRVVIMTGRPYRLAQNIYQTLGLKTPIVTFNGGLALLPGNRKWPGAYQITFEHRIVDQIMQRRRQLGINLLVAEDQRHLMANRPAPENVYQDTLGFFPDHLKPGQVLTNHNLNFKPVCLAVQVKPNHVQKVVNYIKARYSQIKPAPWGGPKRVIELASTQVTKLAGIRRLASYYHVNHQDILAYGDQENDRQLIKYVGHGVAMRNALPQVKAVADQVTKYDNDHDGMAQNLAAQLKIQ